MLKLNLGCGGFPLEGFINMDSRGDLSKIFEERHPGQFNIIDNWKWQDGLCFENDMVDAITESHSLMYLRPEEYFSAFLEIDRVLKPGRVFRITEDNCERPEEELKKDGLPWGNPASVTGPEMMRTELSRVFSSVILTDSVSTYFLDNSLIQENHGTFPRIFHMEVIK